jgi:hypothetical protein
VDIGVDGEAQARLAVDAGGKLIWGSGSVAGDVNLYRHAANTLKTDDTLVVASLFIGDTQITSLSAETSIDGGSENTRVLNAEIVLSTIDATIDGGAV